ncbi:hypothetical protein [Halobellus rubicundus]|uniref:Uncharacterized protein n=1 Tax=Halobellus rubicundus TaxID=2996466 RepID=A0ABD5MHJ5_9EURY
MTWRLYRLIVRNESVLRRGRGLERNTAAISKLTGQSTSEPISLAPGEIRFEFLRSGKLAAKLAREAEELFDAQGYEHVPLFSTASETKTDGYYVLKSADERPLDPASERVHRIDGVLRHAGTRQSHLRTVEITVDTVDNPLGTTEEAYVGVPATATLTRWYDYSGHTLTQATPAQTVATEYGDVELYDVASAPSTTSAALTYDLPYADQGAADVRVWDDRETDLASKTDAEGIVQWGRVFTSSHEYQGRPIVSNARLRVLFDPDPTAQPGLQAERWDAANSQWSAVALAPNGNPDGWALIDADVVTIGPAAVDAQLLFRADDGTEAPLNARLSRGDDVLLFESPPNASDQTPVTLQDLVSPIASDRLQTAGESLGLRAREEVRR